MVFHSVDSLMAKGNGCYVMPLSAHMSVVGEGPNIFVFRFRLSGQGFSAPYRTWGYLWLWAPLPVCNE
jgi:hypothetical protein